MAHFNDFLADWYVGIGLVTNSQDISITHEELMSPWMRIEHLRMECDVEWSVIYADEPSLIDIYRFHAFNSIFAVFVVINHQNVHRADLGILNRYATGIANMLYTITRER